MSARLALITTVTRQAGPEHEARAREVAARCGGRFVARSDGVRRLLRQQAAEVAYVVGPAGASLQSADGERLTVSAGVLPLVGHLGREHPLLRAVAPEGAPAPARVVDATLGLGRDALHLAAILGAELVGLEASPPLACLTEDGLATLAAAGGPWSAAAGRVRVVQGDAAAWLEAQPPGCCEVVFLDPMFPAPLRAAPGFELLRRLAEPAPLGEALLGAALRAARARVVLKLPHGAAGPGLGPRPEVWTGRVEGGRLDYLVAEV